MTALNRKDVRHKFYDLCKLNVPAAEEVFPGKVSSFNGKSPVLVLGSNGTDRTQYAGNLPSPVFGIDIFVFSILKDIERNFTELDSEDAMDDIEFQISQLVAQNQVADEWQSITYSTPTQIDPSIMIDGNEYNCEVISLVFQ
jgi:hypothetical protein